jgi:hypothetical protein
MAILEPTKLETANYGTVGWNAIYSSNFQKINDYLKKFNWSITTITYSASITVDWNASDVQIVTLTGNATINFSNPRSGGKYVLLVKQDGTGGRTITWGSNIVCGLQPKSTANSITAFFFIYDSTNSKYICVQQEAFNADTLDGQHGSYYLDRTNHTGTQPPSTISPQGHGSGLDADRLDDQEGSYYLNRANHTGTQPPSTISPQGHGSGLDADKVDGFHASITPAPNTIPASNSSGILEAGWLAGYFAKLYYQQGPSSQFTTSNVTIYNICSITVPPQPVAPPRGYWYVLAYLREAAFGGNNTAGGSQDWVFRVVRQSDNYVFDIGYLHDYKVGAGDGKVGARGMSYLGNLNINQSETYVFQLYQLGGSYNVTVWQNGFTFYIILI